MTAHSAEITTGNLVRQTGVLFRTSLVKTAIVGGISMLGGLAVDLSGPGDGAAALNLLLSFVLFFLQYWLIATLLDERGLNHSNGGRLIRYFGLNLVMTIAVLLGLALIVIPGLILAARWAVAAPLQIGSERSIVRSLRESWQATNGHVVAILGAFMVVYLPPILLFLGGAVTIDVLRLDLAGIAMMNLGYTIWLIGGCYLSVALYLLIGAPVTLSAVFE